MKPSKRAPRESAPAASAYVCRACKGGFVLPARPCACPRCGVSNAVVEAPVQRAAGRMPVETAEVRVRPVIEQVDGKPQTVGFVKEAKIDQSDTADKVVFKDRAEEIDELVMENRELTMLSDVEPEEFDRFPSHIKAVDRVLDGGLVAGGVVMLAGEKGVGKTTLSTQIVMEHILRYKDAMAFLASGEESLGRFLSRAVRLGYTPKQIKIAAKRIGGCRLKNIEAVHDQAKKISPTILVYDSMPRKFLSPSVKGSKAEMHAVAVMEEIVDFSSAYGVCAIVIGRLTQEGKVSGGEDYLYDLDGAVIRLNRIFTPTKPPKKTRFISLTSDKNRFGAEDVVGYMIKGDTGLKSAGKPKFLSRRR